VLAVLLSVSANNARRSMGDYPTSCRLHAFEKHGSFWPNRELPGLAGKLYIIVVHNHPSGDPTPSQADIDMTRAVAKALHPVGIAVHDHIVIGRGRHASFRTLGLL
jgi:hypothetical protein